MLLPSDFDFNLGGTLPGLMGQAEQSADRFLLRLARSPADATVWLSPFEVRWQ